MTNQIGFLELTVCCLLECCHLEIQGEWLQLAEISHRATRKITCLPYPHYLTQLRLSNSVFF